MVRGPAGTGFESTRLGLTVTAEVKYHSAKSGVLFVFWTIRGRKSIKTNRKTIKSPFSIRECVLKAPVIYRK